MVFKTSTLSPNVNIQVHLRILMNMLKRLMMMRVVDMVFKTATLSLNVTIKVTLRIFMGIPTRVMLLVDMVL